MGGARSRRGISRTEAVIGVSLIAVLVIMGLPLLLHFTKDARRSELLETVDAIRTAEITHKEAYGTYVPADFAPRSPASLSSESVPWVPTPGFEKMKFRPPEHAVRGTYQVEVSEGSFRVVGVIDLDENGAVARAEATENMAATLISDKGVY